MIKLSIIIATFNIENSIDLTLSSIVNSMDRRCELIVIDGGSNDGTCNIINKYNSNIAFFESKHDHGIYDAWNKGIDRAAGNYIMFLGGDDILLCNTLSNYLDYIEKYPELEYISSRVIFGDPRNNKIIGSKWNWRDFSRYMNVAHVGSVHKKCLFQKYGYFNKEFKIAGDYDFMLRIGSELKAGFIDAESVIMGDKGTSTANFQLALKESLIAKLNNRAQSHFFAYIFYLKSYFKNIIKRLIY